MSACHVVPRARMPDAGMAALAYLRQVFGVCAAEVQKLRHDPFELVTRAIQPVLWLVLFGEVMAQVRGLSTGGVRYLDFLSAGILTQSVLFVAIFYGIAAIWERDLGILHRYLVSPAPRSALVLGKALSAGVRGLTQAVVVYVLASLLHVAVSLEPVHLAGMMLLIVLGARPVRHLLAHRRLSGEDTRAVHGHWPGGDHADLLRQQRDLPAEYHACLASGRGAAEPAHLRSRCVARADAARRIERVRHRHGFRGTWRECSRCLQFSRPVFMAEWERRA